MPGGLPRKREEDLARPRERRGGEQLPVTKGDMMPLDEKRLQPDPNWHESARFLWDTCLESGQIAYYQNSDLAMLWTLCDDLSYAKRARVRSGQLLQTIYSALNPLLLTEGARRAARIELQKPSEGKATLHVLGRGVYSDLIDSELEEIG